MLTLRDLKLLRRKRAGSKILEYISQLSRKVFRATAELYNHEKICIIYNEYTRQVRKITQ